MQSTKVLVLAPHPDDELLALHQHILKWQSFGWEVSVLYCTGDGERRAEANAYLEKLPEPVLAMFCYLPDGRLWEHVSELRDIIARQAKFYDIVYSPHWQEPISVTSDHVATCVAARSAVPKHKLCYWLLWSRLRPEFMRPPRHWLRRLRWAMRQLRPYPQAMVTRLDYGEAQAKAKLFVECYSSQAKQFRNSDIWHFCQEEHVYYD